MKTCIIFITADAHALAYTIAADLADCTVIESQQSVARQISDAWKSYDGLICIMATGIVVRSIAPLIADKRSDPCVVVVDQKGEYAISLLSGHLGGGNALATEVAGITGGQPIITTASDVLGKTAIDLWAARNGLIVTDRKKLTTVSAAQVNGASPVVHIETQPAYLPADYRSTSNPALADIHISYRKSMTGSQLHCIPTCLYLGVGCNRGTPFTAIEQALSELCRARDIDPRAFTALATIDLKKDEAGITDFAEKYGLQRLYYPKEQLNGVTDVTFSPAAMKAVGAQGVAEPAALLAAGADNFEALLRVRKMKWQDVTLAVAERIRTVWE